MEASAAKSHRPTPPHLRRGAGDSPPWKRGQGWLTSAPVLCFHRHSRFVPSILVAFPTCGPGSGRFPVALARVRLRHCASGSIAALSFPGADMNPHPAFGQHSSLSNWVCQETECPRFRFCRRSGKRSPPLADDDPRGRGPVASQYTF